MGYMYKATFKDGTFGINGRPYWLMTSTGEFQGKIVSRGKILKAYIKQHGDDDILVEFIQPIKSKTEANAIIKPYLCDPLCLNRLNYKGKKGKGEILTPEKRISFQNKYRETKKNNKQKSFEHAGKFMTYSTGKRRKRFNSFEEFYRFIQEQKVKLEFTSLNFESKKIIDWFYDFYSVNGHTNQREIEKYFACNTDKPNKIEFWLERGWSIEEAEGKVSEVQNKPHKLRFSKASGEVFLKFYDKYSSEYSCFIHSGLKQGSHEYCLYDEELKKCYFYDFGIKELNLLFEYNGEHVHPNPSWAKEKLDNWRSPFSDDSAYKVIEKTNRKIEIAKKRGFNVIEIWSSSTLAKNRYIVETTIDSAIHNIKLATNYI